MKFFRVSRIFCVALAFLLFTLPVLAELRLPALFSDGMVVQRDMSIPVWGWATPGEEVEVEVDGQVVRGHADKEGRWNVRLPAQSATAIPQSIIVTASDETRVINNVLVGEVWVCSGQSNMRWPLHRIYDPDLEAAVARFPAIRYISVPTLGTQELQEDFEGSWVAASPSTVGNFSAVAFLFGRWLHEITDVPVGLIHNSWGGSSAEAWVRRDVLEADGRFADYLDKWRETEATFDAEAEQRKWEEAMEAWRVKSARLKAEGKAEPPRPRAPGNPLGNQHRPGNLYAGMLNPLIGYGIRGVIWYQGESNAGRAWHYRALFPLMIEHWRAEWGQGDFPFYWVQLANFKAEQPDPGESDWAELREAQTLALQLPHTGQAVIYDLGEARDIHPRDKQNVARRLARIALARDYDMNVVHRSPTFRDMEIRGNKLIVRFSDTGDGLYSFDVVNPLGFAVAGADRQWHWAEASITEPDTVEVSSVHVPEPVAVRYAWADNPVATLRNLEGLPVVPFRSDDWPITTQPKETEDSPVRPTGE